MKALMANMTNRSMDVTRSIFGLKGFSYLILVNIMMGVSYSFVLPFNSLFGIDEVGMSNAAFGMFMTISAVSGIIISSVIARLSDQNLSRRTVLLITVGAAVVGYICFAFFRNYYALLFVSAFILGIASSNFAQLFAFARETVSQSAIEAKQLPFYMNIFRMFFALSWTVGPVIASVVLLHYGFTALFLVAAFFYVLIFALLLFFIRPDDKSEGHSQIPKSPVKISSYVLQPFILAHLVAFAMVAAAGVIGTLNMAQFVIKVLGGSEGNIGIIFGLAPVFEIPFMIWFGILATKMDNTILIRLGVLFAAVYFSCFLIVSEPWQIYPLQIITAASIAVTQGIAITYFQNFIPGQLGTATTLYSNSSKAGATVGFLIFGFASELLGYRLVYAICALLAAAALMLLMMFGKRAREDGETLSP
jgi:SET family sugar efflux transporter-like MFS transporter